jgi:hypothetical protein
MKQVVLKAETASEKERSLSLEKHESEIRRLSGRIEHDLIAVAQHLLAIRDQELYFDAGYDNFNKYCAERLHVDRETIRRRLIAAEVLKSLQESGLKELPDKESHLLALQAEEPEQRSDAWQEVLRIAEENEEQEITAALVDKIVQGRIADRGKQLLSPPPKMVKNGAKNALAEPNLDLGSDLPEPKQDGSKSFPETRIRLSENGEYALATIRRLCGDTVANAIENGSLEISEKELILWSEYEDPTRLVYWIVSYRYSVTKAIREDSKLVDGRTTVAHLFYLASVGGGHYETVIEYQSQNLRLVAALENEPAET